MDRAQYDAKPILTQAKLIIKRENLVNVISTGHPVSVNYISTFLKIDMPHINLIQDYRDNWNDLKAYQYPNGLNFFYQKEESVKKEFLTLFYSDLIINVSEDLTQSLGEKHKSLKEKLVTIHNGYDKEDFGAESVQDNTQFNIIYAGSLFNERIEAVYLFLDAVLESKDEMFLEKMKLVLYTNYPKERFAQKYHSLLDTMVIFKDLVKPSELTKILLEYRYCLSINSKFASYAYGTKIFDYMVLNKKIIHISNGGALYKTLESQNQFVSPYDKVHMKNMLLEIKKDFLENLTKKIIQYLK